MPSVAVLCTCCIYIKPKSAHLICSIQKVIFGVSQPLSLSSVATQTAPSRVVMVPFITPMSKNKISACVKLIFVTAEKPHTYEAIRSLQF